MEYAIGIDLGGTSIKYALVDKEGNSSFEGRIPSFASDSAHAVVGQIVKAAESVKQQATAQGIAIKGIGLGTPGIVDETNRIVLGGAENIVGWENIDVASLVEDKLNLPVIVGNDANMMGLGETRYGAARGCSDVVFLTVGTGIGGAVIIGGKLFGGYANRGTELGHVVLMADGGRCACGATGCLEHYASTSALVRDFSKLAKEQGRSFDREINGELIVSLYHGGDQLAIDCMNRHFYYLGRGIAGFVNIFSPQRIVIGGGLPESGAYYIEKITEVVKGQVIADCAVNTAIVAAELGNHAGLVGAASLIL